MNKRAFENIEKKDQKIKQPFMRDLLERVRVYIRD